MNSLQSFILHKFLISPTLIFTVFQNIILLVSSKFQFQFDASGDCLPCDQFIFLRLSTHGNQIQKQLYFTMIIDIKSMRLFSRKQTLHHFKIIFPLPVEKIQNCLKKLQHLNHLNTSAVCISLSGHSESPETCQLFHQSLLNLRENNRLSVFAFLEDKATSLTYFTATAAQTISANPYSLIGDVATTQKTYRNIKKLLDLIGIKYSELGTNNQSSQLWNQFVEKSEREKELTKKWLAVVQKNMADSLTRTRKIAKEDVQALSNKVFHPKDALKAKLIDSITTFEQFSSVSFPNHQVEDLLYKLDGTRLRSTFTQKEISAFTTLFQVIQMPRVALLSSEDLVMSSVKEIIELIGLRLENSQELGEVQQFLGKAFELLETKVEGGLVF